MYGLHPKKTHVRSNIAKAAAATIPVFAALVVGGSQAAEAGAPAPSYNVACVIGASTTATWSHPPQHVKYVFVFWIDESTGSYAGDPTLVPVRGHSASAPTPAGADTAYVNWYGRGYVFLHGESANCS